MKFKLTAALLLVVLSIGLVSGCGNDTTVSKKLRIGVFYDASVNRQQEQYFDAIANAVIAAQKKFPDKLEVDHIRIPITSDSRINFIEAQLAGKQYDMVIDSDIAYTNTMESVAAKNTNTSFVIVDPGSKTTTNPPNLAYLVFDEKQQGFVAGVIAALKTPGKIVHLDLSSDDVNPGYDQGIQAGIKAVNNGSSCATVLVAKDMTAHKDLPGNDLYDITLSKADELYKNGVSIIISDWEVDQLAVLTAARTNKKMMIASDIALAQISSGATSEFLLDSIVKNYALAITDIISKKIDGKFKGEKVIYNLQNKGILYDTESRNNATNLALIEQAGKYVAKLTSGQIKID